jgi:hypothetical protein
VDSTGATYREACHLVSLLTDSERRVHRTRAKTPLVVGVEEDVQFMYFTSNTQKEMDRPSAFRDAFSSRNAICWLEFGIEKVGIQRQKVLKTPRVPFKES